MFARTAIAALWLAGVGLATRSVMTAQSVPGPDRATTDQWPAAAAALPRRGVTLVLAAHPKCPCTGASLEQLARVVTRASGPVTAYVLFTRPEDVSPSWARTRNWTHAAEIPGVTPMDDAGGRLARAFGAATSGHCFVYDADGVLRFSGGLTAARGLEGDCAGSASALAALRSGTPPFARTPVFGCPLVEPVADR